MVLICNYSRSWNPIQSHILLCSLIVIAVYFLSVLPDNHATALTFNLSKIDSNQIQTYGKAYISPEGIQLTTSEREQAQIQQAGRATHKQLLHLWDKKTGKLADFNTHFSFVIDSTGDTVNYGDGLAFFLTPNDSIDSNIPAGGCLGLPINATNLTATSPFVAVEFDTYYHLAWPAWDPVYDTPGRTHVGIDINSLNSSATMAWYSDISGGIENEAWISYNSSSKNLRIIFTDNINNLAYKSGLNFTIDMRDHLPEWVAVGFSASTGAFFESHTVQSWRFNSTLQIDTATTNTPTTTPTTNNNNNKTILVVGLTIGSSVLVGGLALLGFHLWKASRKKVEDGFEIEMCMDDEFESGRGPKKISYSELTRATNNFAEEQKLGEGGFGGVYRGFLRDFNSYVAVKRISKTSKQGIKEYASEVKIISRLRHRNLVQLLGWCHEKKELLLVYEFMENGSLDSHLFKEKSLLTWAIRFKIAQGLASALLYLHEEWEQCVVHRDLKSSNVMLDSNFNAKLGDFGLARLVDHGKGSQTTVLAGSMGYMAPECFITGKASKESDVYSFGIVALEIACGRKPIDLNVQENQTRILEWVWNLYGIGKLLEAVDLKMGADFDKQEVECLMIVGLWCAYPDHNIRPSIKQAIHVLNFEAPLPILPAKMPVPTYFAPPVSLASLNYGNTSVAANSQIQSSSYSYNADSSKFTSSSAASSTSGSLLCPKTS